MTDYAPVGLAGIDKLPWGSHLCQFFANGDELRHAIVPYFKAGLENDERCLLVAMDPYGADDARNALRAAVGDFDRRELAKQIEIHDVRTWYAAAGAIESGRMAEGLLRSEEQARADGFKGFRTNGNIGWLQRDQWADFQDYESRVSRGLKGRRMISMCVYCLDSCGPRDVLDVVCRHDVTVGRNADGGASMAASGDELARRSATEKRLFLLVQELEHRIRTTSRLSRRWRARRSALRVRWTSSTDPSTAASGRSRGRIPCSRRVTRSTLHCARFWRTNWRSIPTKTPIASRSPDPMSF